MGLRVTVWVIGLGLILGLATTSQAALFNLVPGVPFEVSGGDAEYIPAEKLLVITGHGNVIYRDSSLTGDQIVLDMQQNELRAVGHVTFYYNGQNMFGDHFRYDLKSGEAFLGRSSYDSAGFYFKGDRITVNKNEEIQIDNATVTTCDLAVPHYYLSNRTLRMQMGKRFWTYDTVLHIGNMPVLWLPFFTRSLQKTWNSYILSAGYDRYRGAAMYNKYVLHFNRWAMMAVYADLYSKSGIGWGGKEGYYGKDRTRLNGQVTAYRVEIPGTDQHTGLGSRYEVRGQHHQEIGQYGTVISQYQKLSDRDYNQDFDDVEELHGWNINDVRYDRDSFVDLAYTLPDYQLRILGKDNLDDFQLTEFAEDERLPELRLASRNQRLWDTPLFAQFHLDYSRLDVTREIREGNLNNTKFLRDGRWLQTEWELDRLNFGGEVEWPITTFDWLRLRPFVGYELIGYNSPDWQQQVVDAQGGRAAQHANGTPATVEHETWDSVTQNVGKVGVRMSTRLEADGPCLPRYKTTRWVTEPAVTVSANEMSENLTEHLSTPGGVPFMPTLQTDDTDTFLQSTESAQVSWDTFLEGKDQWGIPQNILKESLGFGREYLPDDGQSQWDTVFAEFQFQPLEWLSFHDYLQYDPTEIEPINTASIQQVGGKMSSMNHGVDWTLHPRFKLSAGYNEFHDPFVPDSSQFGERNVTVAFNYRPSDKWTVDFSDWYDIESSQTRETRLSLTRDLHDIDAIFTVRQRNRVFEPKDLQFHFNLRWKLPQGLTGVF